jgi:hypothetical protein
MNEEVPVAEEFWLTLARNDRAEAHKVIKCLDLPLVATSTFSFEEIEGEFHDAQERETLEQRGAQGALSPKLVSADTPMATIDAWNATDCVALLLVSSNEICGAQVMDGEVDFLTCARALDCPGGTSCRWTTHATGGKDVKGHLVLKMKLPEGGRKVFAIPVKTSRSAVKQPKIFSLPMLAQVDLPYNILAKGWDETLTTLKLCAREWKFFIEIYRGPSWLLGLLNGRGVTGVTGERRSLDVPSPRMGKGGYDPKDFEDKLLSGVPCSPLFKDRAGCEYPGQEP